MKQIIRTPWYKALDRTCCATCINSESYGHERPPSDWSMCKIFETPVRLLKEHDCTEYKRGE